MRHTGTAARVGGILVLAVAVTLIAAAGAFAATPAPPPPSLPEIESHTVELRYLSNRGYIMEAALIAEESGDSERAATLRAMAGRDRDFLVFDGRGNGRAVEVIGELAEAQRVAVLVPGADTSIDTFDGRNGVGESARNLHEGISRAGAGDQVAVVAWLGYAAPDTLSLAALTTGRADDGAAALRRFVASLGGVNDADVTLFCHSYGSVVCGRAASDLPVSDIVAYGSPGLGADSFGELDTEARVWAARSEGDWIGRIPHASLTVLDTTFGFGTDPIDPSFGASRLEGGDGEHGDYLDSTSPLVEVFALIAAGRPEEAAHA